ncbi:MAG: hypothetical protein ABH810_02440 [bacterium]
MKKYLIYVLATAVICVGLPAYLALANYDNGEGINVGVRLDVCNKTTCALSDWHNYSIDSEGDGETLTAAAGDTINFMGTTWNEGTVDLTATFLGEIVGSDYFDSVDVFTNGTDDIDANGTAYVLDSNADSDGTYTMNISLDDNFTTASNSDNPEVGQIIAVLKDDVPAGTVITATFGITDVTDIAPMTVFTGLDKAHAQARTLTESTVRIVVGETTTPTPTATVETSTPTPTPAILPKTGAHTK